MALISCPECNKEISEKAIACPYCGYPMDKQSKQGEFLCCPKCGSRELHAEHKGFSGGKALAGALVTGGIGLLAGTIGSRDTQITCLKCGNKFKAGEAIVRKENDNISEDESIIVGLLNSGKFLEATKWYKEKNNCGLKEAKDAIEAIAAKHKIKTTSDDNFGIGCAIVLIIVIFITIAILF